MKKTLLATFFLCFLGLILWPSCSKKCDMALPDMTGQVTTDSNSVMAGEEYYFDHNIDNVEDELCEATETAGFSRTTYEVEYAPNASSAFQLDSNGDAFIDTIPAGSSRVNNYSATFEEPGIYRIIVAADGKANVDERNEGNNIEQENATGRSSSNWEDKPGAFIVYVRENPKYKSTRKENEPRVKIKLLRSLLIS